MKFKDPKHQAAYDPVIANSKSYLNGGLVPDEVAEVVDTIIPRNAVVVCAELSLRRGAWRGHLITDRGRLLKIGVRPERRELRVGIEEFADYVDPDGATIDAKGKDLTVAMAIVRYWEIKFQIPEGLMKYVDFSAASDT